MGVKKSTVCTSARLSVSLYTPASSLVSKPTSTFSFGTRGKLASTLSKTFGLSLDAQPAAFTCAVNLALKVPPDFFCAHPRGRRNRLPHLPAVPHLIIGD